MTKNGQFVWLDLTVPNADEVSSFYCTVLGWKRESLLFEDSDFNIFNGEDKDPIAGVCYARGVNADVPPQWLNYVQVENVYECAERCKASGGEVVNGPRKMGGHDFCVLRDPAGAYIAVIAPSKDV